MRLTRPLVLAAPLIAVGCAISSIDTIERDGARYAVVAVTKPADDFVVVTVGRLDRPPVETVRATKAAHRAAARDKLIEECRKKGDRRPTARDVVTGFAERLDTTGRTAAWTFVRNCV